MFVSFRGMKTTIIILLSLLLVLSSCSIQKRLYNKGFYASKSHTNKKPDIKDTTKSVSLLNTIKEIKKDNPSLLHAKVPETINVKEKQIKYSNTSALNRKETKFIILKHLILEGDSVLKQKLNEYPTRKLAKNSFTLGIISLICTIGFFLYPITVPAAIICGIIAIRKGRKAIEQMGNDTELNDKYRLKAIKGIKLGLSFFLFLLTLLHIAIIVGIAYLILLGFLYFVIVSNIVAASLIICIVLGLCAIFGVVMLYLFLLKKVIKLIPPKKTPL